jgi:hypothetical protein
MILATRLEIDCHRPIGSKIAGVLPSKKLHDIDPNAPNSELGSYPEMTGCLGLQFTDAQVTETVDSLLGMVLQANHATLVLGVLDVTA